MWDEVSLIVLYFVAFEEDGILGFHRWEGLRTAVEASLLLLFIHVVSLKQLSIVDHDFCVMSEYQQALRILILGERKTTKKKGGFAKEWMT